MMEDLYKLKELLLKPPKILSERSYPDLEDIGGLEELNDCLYDNDNIEYPFEPKFVPFDYSIPYEEQDPELLNKLWQERDEIVTKCLLAVRDMLYAGRSFSCEPYDPDEYCNDTLASDSIRDYVNENIIISRDKADEMSTSEMYTDYRNWCESNSLIPEAQCKFSTSIGKMYGIGKRKKYTSESNIWVFVGVRYNSP